jgi:hypothetical protein
MKSQSEFTKAEAKAYWKAKMVEFDVWIKERKSMGKKYTWWGLWAMKRSWKETVRCLLTDSKEEREAFEEMDRITSAPDFDERAYEEEAFGPYVDDDDLYTPEGYYIFADRYDEAAKQRPPVRKARATAEAQPKPEPDPTKPKAEAEPVFS